MPMPTRKPRLAINEGSTKGWWAEPCRRVKPMNATRPNTNSTTILPGQPAWGPLTKAMPLADAANASSTTLAGSSRAAESAGGVRGNTMCPRTKASSPIGTFNRKTARHPKPARSASISSPPSGAAEAATKPKVGARGAKAACKRSLGKLSRMHPSPCGIISDPATPWTTRPPIRIVAFGASPVTSEPSVKPASPAKNRGLRPKMSPKRPEIISPIAKASV